MNNKISIQIQDVMGRAWTFENLKEFISFLKHEIEFWDKQTIGVSNPHEYFGQRGILNNTLQMIDTWVTQIDSWDENKLNSEINTLRQNYLNSFSTHWLWSSHAFVSAWIDACKLSNLTGNAFIGYIKNKQIQNIQDYLSFKGYMLAYEFEMQDESTITKRRNAEKVSFTQLRNRLDKTTNVLIKDVDEFKNDFNGWHEDTKKAFDNESGEHHKAFSDNQMQRNAEFEQYMSDCKSKIDELENTYHEKLRLEKPADYWNKKAGVYKVEGDRWAKLLIVLLSGGFVVFALLFYFWLIDIKVGLELKSLQGAIVFATMLTIYAVAIKAISKMVFSSYHLQRDAEEREQLTYVYLALTNEEKHIDEESRKIVLQALFSRADTGLLGKDSSPTMPSGGFADLIKALGNSR